MQDEADKAWTAKNVKASAMEQRKSTGSQMIHRAHKLKFNLNSLDLNSKYMYATIWTVNTYECSPRKALNAIMCYYD